MNSLLELDELEAARPAPRGTRPAGRAQLTHSTTPVIQRHPRLGYLQVYPPTGRSRPQREMEFEVTGGTDTRGPVMDTSPIPYRFICWLDLDFGVHPVTGQHITARGSGTLIGPRHVLTAGHNLFDVFAGVNLPVQEVRVGPGFNCIAKRGDVFGMARSLRTRVSDRWRDHFDNEFDYGVITLRTPIGESQPAALGGTLGWWGSRDFGGDTRINPVPVARLRGMQVGVSGYPGDKCCVRATDLAQLCRPTVLDRPCPANLWATAQFRAFGRITDPAPAVGNRMLLYDADTCGGHSGSPIWVAWQDPASGILYRNLVGIHTGALTGIANRGTRITEDVMTDVRRLMRAP